MSGCAESECDCLFEQEMLITIARIEPAGRYPACKHPVNRHMNASQRAMKQQPVIDLSDWDGWRSLISYFGFGTAPSSSPVSTVIPNSEHLVHSVSIPEASNDDLQPLLCDTSKSSAGSVSSSGSELSSLASTSDSTSQPPRLNKSRVRFVSIQNGVMASLPLAGHAVARRRKLRNATLGIRETTLPAVTGVVSPNNASSSSKHSEHEPKGD